MAAEYKRRAAEQLEAIVSYIAQTSPQNALIVLTLIEEAADFLDRNPRLGRERFDLGPGIRTWPVSSFMIVYRERSEGGALIVGVAHGHQLLQALAVRVAARPDEARLDRRDAADRNWRLSRASIFVEGVDIQGEPGGSEYRSRRAPRSLVESDGSEPVLVAKVREQGEEGHEFAAQTP
jgi:toxin ParE1/3/4